MEKLQEQIEARRLAFMLAAYEEWTRLVERAELAGRPEPTFAQVLREHQQLLLRRVLLAEHARRCDACRKLGIPERNMPSLRAVLKESEASPAGSLLIEPVWNFKDGYEGSRYSYQQYSDEIPVFSNTRRRKAPRR